MMRTYIFSFSPRSQDGCEETEFQAGSDAEAMELFERFCQNELDGFVPEKLKVVAVDDCEDDTGYEDTCL